MRKPIALFAPAILTTSFLWIRSSKLRGWSRCWASLLHLRQLSDRQRKNEYKSSIYKCCFPYIYLLLKHFVLIFQEFNTKSLMQGPPPPTTSQSPQKPMKPAPKREDKAAWFKLFAELDPLANPDSLPGANSDHSHAA